MLIVILRMKKFIYEGVQQAVIDLHNANLQERLEQAVEEEEEEGPRFLGSGE